MPGIVPTRWLPAILLFAVLPAAPQSRLAFNSDGGSADGAAGYYIPNAPIAEPSNSTRPPIQLPPEAMGDIYLVRQHYSAAIQAYQTIETPSAVVWNKMGIAYQQLFALREAERCYKQSLKMDPKNPKVINNLATVQDGLTDFSAAEKNYRKALKLNPNSAIEMKNLGTSLLMQHKYGEGAALYKQALAIDPTVFDNHFGPKVNDPAPKEEHGTANYFKAKSCARAGMTECALAFLNKAFDEGAVTVQKVRQESDFSSLLGTPGMNRLLANQQ